MKTKLSPRMTSLQVFNGTIKVWAKGDRVSFSASPSCAENRRVYNGTIVDIIEGGALAVVRDDGWGAECHVAIRFLHPEGAFIINDFGPLGIRWTD